MKDGMAVVVVAAIFMAFVIGFGFATMASDSNWRRDAIRYNAGHYDSTTGNFIWNNPPTPAH